MIFVLCMLLMPPGTKNYYDAEGMSKSEVVWYRDIYQEIHRIREGRHVRKHRILFFGDGATISGMMTDREYQQLKNGMMQGEELMRSL